MERRIEFMVTDETKKMTEVNKGDGTVVNGDQLRWSSDGITVEQGWRLKGDRNVFWFIEDVVYRRWRLKTMVEDDDVTWCQQRMLGMFF
ncbi:hypothetical protein HanIR_Chr08g0345701 [Helianthus annuus]|nr:hypothetical protein HanIR_Chr08g0345701 [Helianthus annuus]